MKYTAWCSRTVASNFEKDSYSIEIARLDLSSVDSGVLDFSPSRQSGTYSPVSYTHLTLPTNREV